MSRLQSKQEKKNGRTRFSQVKKRNQKLAKDNDKKTEDFLENQQTKMIIDLDWEMSASVKSLAVNKTSVVKLTTRFFSEKMLMFAKLSLMSFIYDMLEIFYFPNDRNHLPLLWN